MLIILDLESNIFGADSRLSGYIGSLVTLVFSGVAFLTSAVLPYLVEGLKVRIFANRLHQHAEELDRHILRIVWSLSLAASAALMFSTFFAKGFIATTVLMALNGISWAVANWVPFALINQLIAQDTHMTDLKAADTSEMTCTPPGGSMIGLHNAAISAPQIVAAGICAVILWQAQIAGSPYGAGWVLRVGGCAYLAASGFAFSSLTDRSSRLPQMSVELK